MTLKDTIKLVMPSVFIQLVRRLRSNRQTDTYGLSGDYHEWDEAMIASNGYDSEVILEKTKTSLLKVKSGEAVYERDSVLFDEIQYAWPVLSGLMWVAAQHGGTLNVLDFGGSLGSSYFQNRAFLSMLPHVRWNIVEQPRHVETGKTWFEDAQLRFYADIVTCLADTQPNVVLLGGVLQYVDRPYYILNQILDLPCDHIIIDRMPFWAGSTDRLCVQRIPPSIYPATYPSWIFSVACFHTFLKNKSWQILTEFDSLDKLNAPVNVISKGMILQCKKHRRVDAYVAN